MSIVTLTTDFGLKDYYLPAIKAKLYSLSKDINIVDISHSISPYNIVEAAFTLKASYPHFPDNTIHIIGIDTIYSPENKHLLVKFDDQIFIGPDNGIFSLINDIGKFGYIKEIKHPLSEKSNFPVLDVFVDIAGEILNRKKISAVDYENEQVKKWVKTNPTVAKENELIGHVIYIDNYGNLATDIPKDLFNNFTDGRKFEIVLSHIKINQVFDTYHAYTNAQNELKYRFVNGEALAIFNSLHLLEIVLYRSNPNHGGSAASLLGMQVDDSIIIRISH